MITNNSITIYHKGFDAQTRLETYTRYNYSKVWFFGGKGASLNEGLTDKNDVQIRIPYNQNDRLDVNNFAVGDIIVEGTLDTDITTQSDLKEYTTYNITSINNNNFGNNQHIHIGGK